MKSFVACALLAGLCATAAPSVKRWAPPSPALSLNQNEQEVFDISMQINDWAWDYDRGLVASDDDNGHDSTRFSAWYCAGLLKRNQGDDVQRAITAIKNIISLQFTDPSDVGTPWWGTYKQASDIPTPNNLTYTPSIYNSYDPNWGFFIGDQLVQIVAEFEHLLPEDLVNDMVNSCYIAARQMMARVGYNGDNLVTAYSNPAIGRAILVSWVGNRIQDANLTAAGEQYAKNIYDLFTADGYNTLGEYNVPTYYGIDVFGLTSWIRYGASNSSLPGYATYILQHLWEDIADHYNYELKNFVGPYDRVYHRNSLIDSNIISAYFWMLLGRDVSPVCPIGMDSAQYDLRQGAAFSLMGQTLRSVLPQSTIDRLTQSVGSNNRDFTRYIRVSLDNDTIRTNTAWMSDNLMMGGQQIAAEVPRGFQFTPMITHWKSADSAVQGRPFVSFFQLSAPETATLNATVTPNHISISFPNTSQPGTDSFVYFIGDIPAPWYNNNPDGLTKGFGNLPCLNVTVSSQGVNDTVTMSQYGDDSTQGNNCKLRSDPALIPVWTVTYYVDSSFNGTPSMDFDVQYTC